MRRTIIIAVTGITALLLAGCSASDPEETPAPTASSSSPSTEDVTPEQEDGTPEESASPEEDKDKGTDEKLDEFANEMFLAVTGNLGSSSNLSEEDRVSIGQETCLKIESEGMDFGELSSWAEKEGELPEGAGEVLVSAAINSYCPNHADLITDYKGIDMEDL